MGFLRQLFPGPDVSTFVQEVVVVPFTPIIWISMHFEGSLVPNTYRINTLTMALFLVCLLQFFLHFVCPFGILHSTWYKIFVYANYYIVFLENEGHNEHSHFDFNRMHLMRLKVYLDALNAWYLDLCKLLKCFSVKCRI